MDKDLRWQLVICFGEYGLSATASKVEGLKQLNEEIKKRGTVVPENCEMIGARKGIALPSAPWTSHPNLPNKDLHRAKVRDHARRQNKRDSQEIDGADRTMRKRGDLHTAGRCGRPDVVCA
jgi:hypothetical protein